MKERRYRREEGRNNAEKAYIPKGRLEDLLVKDNCYFGKLNSGVENGN